MKVDDNVLYFYGNNDVQHRDGPAWAAIQKRHWALWRKLLRREVFRRVSVERVQGPEGAPHKEETKTQRASLRQQGLRGGFCV